MGYGYSPSYLYQGQNTDIDFLSGQAPTRNGSGGVINFKVARNNTITPFDRGWFANNGNFILAGKSAIEACGNTYPYNWSATGALTYPSPSSPCNVVSPLDTTGWANQSIILTPYDNSALDSNNAGIAMRVWNSLTTGLDIGWNGSTSTVDFMTVTGGVRTVAESFNPSTGAVTGKATTPLYNTSGTLQSAPHMVQGSGTTNGSGDLSVTLSGAAAFTSSGSYQCYGTTFAGTGVTFSFSMSSGSAFTITTNVITTPIQYLCIGN